MDHHLVFRVELLYLFLFLCHELPQVDPFHVQRQVLLVSLFLFQVGQVSLEQVLELKQVRFVRVVILTIQRVAKFLIIILDLYLVYFILHFKMLKVQIYGTHLVSSQASIEVYPLLRLVQLPFFPMCLYCFSLITHQSETVLISFVSPGLALILSFHFGQLNQFKFLLILVGLAITGLQVLVVRLYPLAFLFLVVLLSQVAHPYLSPFQGHLALYQQLVLQVLLDLVDLLYLLDPLFQFLVGHFELVLRIYYSGTRLCKYLQVSRCQF